MVGYGLTIVMVDVPSFCNVIVVFYKKILLMKEYFVTFCIAFFMTVFAWFFNYFQSLPIAALGGLPLAAVAYWRMAVVNKAGLSLTSHTVAFMLGWFLIFAAVIFPMLKSTLGSVMIYCSWGLAALLACIVYRFRRKIVASAVVSAAVWLLFVTFALPAWEDYLKTWPKNKAGWVMPWNEH